MSSDQHSNQQATQPVEEFTRVESIFVRHRNVLFLKADFVPIFTDYYLHLMEHELRHKESLDAKLKDLLAMLTLHLTARPWAEIIAWTANIRAPRVNFFATGSSINENITGTLFTENVRETDRNLLFNQTIVKDAAGRKSTIEVKTDEPLEWLESYYTESEQRPGRAFNLGEDHYALLAAQPGYDREWFESLTTESVKEILEKEETKLLETRKFKFDCGCSEEKLMSALIGYKDRPEELFGDQNEIHATCPRCSAKFTFSRELFDKLAALDTKAKQQSQEKDSKED